MNRIQRDGMIIFIMGIVLLAVPIGWGWKITLFAVAVILTINFPLIRLGFSEFTGGRVTQQEVLLTAKVYVWMTVPEFQAVLEAKRREKISLQQVMKYVYRLKKEGVLEGRQRQPPQPAFFSEGNIWEYHRRM